MSIRDPLDESGVQGKGQNRKYKFGSHQHIKHWNEKGVQGVNVGREKKFEH